MTQSPPGFGLLQPSAAFDSVTTNGTLVATTRPPFYPGPRGPLRLFDRFATAYRLSLFVIIFPPYSRNFSRDRNFFRDQTFNN